MQDNFHTLKEALDSVPEEMRETLEKHLRTPRWKFDTLLDVNGNFKIRGMLKFIDDEDDVQALWCEFICHEPTDINSIVNDFERMLNQMEISKMNEIWKEKE